MRLLSSSEVAPAWAHSSVKPFYEEFALGRVRLLPGKIVALLRKLIPCEWHCGLQIPVSVYSSKFSGMSLRHTYRPQRRTALVTR